MKRFLTTLFFILFFYFLFLAQTSFAFQLGVSKLFFLLILFLLFLLIFFEEKVKAESLVVAFFSGLFLDFFSLKFLGFYALIFLASAIVLKFVFKKPVRFTV
jgi:cell shape-determining protein MreD